LVILSAQGCLSSEADLPANAIREETPDDAFPASQGVKQQPTILRAEVAAPPSSGDSAGVFLGGLGSEPRSNAPTRSLTVNPHIADLLPISSLDAPPSQR